MFIWYWILKHFIASKSSNVNLYYVDHFLLILFCPQFLDDHLSLLNPLELFLFYKYPEKKGKTKQKITKTSFELIQCTLYHNYYIDNKNTFS